MKQVVSCCPFFVAGGVMSEKTDKKIKRMPSFTKPAVRNWINRKLAVKTPHAEAAAELLKVFPEYDSSEYGDYDKRIAIIKQRFNVYLYSPRYKNYHEIRELRKLDKTDLQEISDLYNPLERLFWLETMLMSGDSDYTVSEELKILQEIGKLADRIMGIEANKVSESTYGGAAAKPTGVGYGMVGGVKKVANSE